jgi:hypothetical protein
MALLEYADLIKCDDDSNDDNDEITFLFITWRKFTLKVNGGQKLADFGVVTTIDGSPWGATAAGAGLFLFLHHRGSIQQSVFSIRIYRG